MPIPLWLQRADCPKCMKKSVACTAPFNERSGPVKRGTLYCHANGCSWNVDDAEYDRQLKSDHAWEQKEIVDDVLGRVVHKYCSCGGSGPNDPKACDSCKIYHEFNAKYTGE